MNKIQSAPIPSTLHCYNTVYSTPPLSLSSSFYFLYLHTHLPSTVVFTCFLTFHTIPAALSSVLHPFTFWSPFPPSPLTISPSLFFLCPCNDHFTFSTYQFLPLPPHLPQWAVHSPPGSRCSSGTGCWSRRGEG